MILVGFVLLVVAGGTTFTADVRFEHFWAPREVLGQQLRLLDESGTLGGATPFFAPVQSALLASLDAVGISPGVAERILHLLYVVVAGLGMAEVVRLVRPRFGVEHFVAALLYAFGPFASQYLLPSTLFVSAAVAPWLVVAAARGVRGRPWLHAAVVALAVALCGDLNPAGLAYAAVPAVVVAGCVAWLEGRWAGLARFGGACVVLVTLVVLPMLLRTSIGSDVVAQNLSTTETPRVVARTATWSESLRGLGEWLSYQRRPDGSLAGDAVELFSNPFVIAATFLLPLVALWTLQRVPARVRFTASLVAAVSLVLMVGQQSRSTAAPLGALLRRAYDDIPALWAVRSTYKAGPGLVMVTAGLVGIAAARALGEPRRRLAAAGAIVAALVLAGVTAPFWKGHVYSSTDVVEAVPEHWRAAAAWLDAQPGAGRVLVLPGAPRARHAWGYPGDDVVDALVRRPVVSAGFDAAGPPPLADVVTELDEYVGSRAYAPGVLGEVARRLGVEYVLVRHDLESGNDLVEGDPIPGGLLGAEPDMAPAATFGSMEPEDGGDHRSAVEIYRVDGAGEPGRLVATTSELVVSGDGAAWPWLAMDGDLAAGRAVTLTSNLSSRELADALSHGAEVIVTDTNRRRSVSLTSDARFPSHTLTSDGTLDRPLPEEDLPSQSLALHGDARALTASRYGVVAQPQMPWYRPAAAVDGDLATAWLLPDRTPVGGWWEAELRAPQPLTSVRLRQPAGAARPVTAVRVHLSDGTEVDADLADLDEVVELPGAPTGRLRIEIRDVDGPGSELAGFSEIEVEGAHLEERIALPTDVADAAAADPDVAEALRGAPLAFDFRREIGSGPVDVERSLHRRFRTPDARTYELSGRFGPDAARDVPRDRCIDIARVDDRPVRVRVARPSTDAGPVRFEGCDPISLEPGDHDLDTIPARSPVIDTIRLSSHPSGGGAGERVQPSGSVRTVDDSATRVELAVEADGEALAVTDVPYRAGWSARVDGRSRHVESADGFAAVAVGPDDREVVLEYGPQRWYVAALAGFALGVVGSCALVVVGLRRSRRSSR